jgi:hypothetical protein
MCIQALRNLRTKMTSPYTDRARARSMPWAPIVLSHDDGAHDRLSAAAQLPSFYTTTLSLAWTKALSPFLRAIEMSKDHMWCGCSHCSLADGGRLLQTKRTRQRHLEADRCDHRHVAVEERESAENPHRTPAINSRSSDSEPGEYN